LSEIRTGSGHQGRLCILQFNLILSDSGDGTIPSGHLPATVGQTNGDQWFDPFEDESVRLIGDNVRCMDEKFPGQHRHQPQTLPVLIARTDDSSNIWRVLEVVKLLVDTVSA